MPGPARTRTADIWEDCMKLRNKALWGAAAAALLASTPAMADTVTACLITKTDANPFFAKMKEGAEAKAKELGVTLKSYAGKVDGDHDAQVIAIESCIADGAKGILIAASDTKAIVDPLKKIVSRSPDWPARQGK